MRTRCGVAHDTRVLVGVSGGRDSVALLRALVELAPRNRWRLRVAHFDHRLRSDSAQDAEFVAELAAELGLRITTGTWGEPQPGEDAARRARHAFLIDCAREHDCEVIALAHQLEDQIETVLMRLGRGTGPRGLAGIPWRRTGPVDVVRPLLDCRRADLTAYLRSLEQAWREDPTNQDDTRTRNRVRRDMLPVLEQTFGAESLESWVDSLDDLRVVLDFVNASAGDLLQRVRRRSPLDGRGRIEVCDVGPLREAPAAVCAAALQQWLEAFGCADLRRQQLRAAVDLIQNGQSGHRIMLAGGHSVALEQRAVVVAVAPQPVSVTLDPRATRAVAAVGRSEPAAQIEPETSEPLGRLDVAIADAVPDRAMLVRDSTRFTAPDAFPAEFVGWIDADAASPQPWTVRLPEPGERARLLGAPGSRKIARILQHAHVPRRLRAAWPVVADAHGILWVPGMGVAERARVRSATQRAARLTLRTRASKAARTEPAAPPPRHRSSRARP